MPDVYPSENILGSKVYKVPVSKVYEALKEEHGHVELIREEWFSYGNSERGDSGVVVGACILGQGSINMGIANDSTIGINIPLVKSEFASLYNQLNRFKVPVNSKWYMGDGSTVGETIVKWNDKRSESCTFKRHGPERNLTHNEIDWDALNQSINKDDWAYLDDQAEFCEFGYELPTYDDVLDMAHDLLQPYFHETVFLTAYDWETKQSYEIHPVT